MGNVLANRNNMNSFAGANVACGNYRNALDNPRNEYVTEDMGPGKQTHSQAAVNKRFRVRALFPFDEREPGELSFKKGDIMEVLSNSDDSWYRVRHLRTKKTGYIPSTYVVKDDGGPQSVDGWFNIGRREANRLLLMMGNPLGTYIIRPSSAPQSYALSIRHHDSKTDIWYVKHYKIKVDANNRYFIVTQKCANLRNCQTMDELINYFKSNPGLCCQLSNPCPRDYTPPVQFRDIEVNRNGIDMKEKIGEGSFGEVWRGVWSNCVEVAVKLMKTGTTDPQRFIDEAKIMHRLHHPRIVQILGVCTKGSPTYIITEYMTNGSLLNFLREKWRSLKFNDLIDMMAQVTDGMAYLESNQFVHRDLRAANILVGATNDVKVADFGLAHMTENEDDIYKGSEATKFPVKWTAPEAQQSRRFSIKSDVWSFGVLMYEIVTFGRSPYPGISNAAVYSMIQNGYRMPNPHSDVVKCPGELYEIMLECWNLSPDARPTFTHLNHVFDDWSISTETQYL